MSEYLNSIRVTTKRGGSPGIVLISLLVFMTMAIIVAVASVSLIINKRQSSQQIAGSTQALNLAESGIENAMLKLIRNPNYAGEILQLPEGDVIIHVSGSDPYNISAEATVGNFIKTVEAETAFINGTLEVISYGEIYYDCSPLPWYNDEWVYRIKNIIRSNKVEGNDNLTDFPVLFSFKESMLVGNTQQNGEDIVFVDKDNNKLSHEIENFDAVTGEIIAWVKMPTLSPTVDTPIYIYFGNPSAPNQANPEAVWSNGYEAVYHLHDDFLDSTSKNHDGTNNGTIDIKGITGNGQDWEFYHGQDYIDIGNWNLTGRKVTLEAWALYESFGHPWARLISKSNANTYPGVNFMLATWEVGTNVVPRSMFRTTSNSNASIHYPNTGWNLSANKWYMFSSSFDGDLNNNHVVLHLNGDTVLSESRANVPPRDLFQNSWQIYLGNNPVVFDRNIDGRMDEVRISSSVRSPEWLKTQYNNMSLPTAFTKSCGPETEMAPPPTPTITPTLYPTAPAWCSGTVWYHPHWSHRKQLTIQETQVAGTSSYLDYPAFVSFSDANLAATAKSDGSDIRFVGLNGVALDFELEYYDPATGTVQAWVRIPTVSATTNTNFYIYYGNSIAGSVSNPDGVWNESYEAVYHMHTNPVGTPPQILDSTLEYSGVSNGLMTSTDVVTGKVGLATDFDGSDDYIQTGGIFGGNQSHAALSGWAKVDSYSTNQAIFSKAFGHDTHPRIYYQANTNQLWLQYSVDGNSQAIIFSNFSNLIPAGQWFNYSVVFDAAINRVTFKINNGQLSGSNTHAGMDSFTGGGFLPRIGYDSNLGYRFDGNLDEIRFYSDSVEDNLLTTEYNNQSNPGQFITVGQSVIRTAICVSPTPAQSPTPTLAPTKPAGSVQSFRVTTYEIEPGTFSGTTYSLPLQQNLSSQYFVSINGASSLSPAHGGSYDAVRVTADPFAHFGSSTAANQLQLSRGTSGGDSWQGSITVVECVSDCDRSGFILKEVKQVALPLGTINDVQTISTTLNSSHTARTVPFAGKLGGGITTTGANPTEYSTTLATRIKKAGTNQLHISRRSADGQYAREATVTVYVTEWGSEWNVQSVDVAGTNQGDSIDAESEYNVSFIDKIEREGTWVWGSGYTANSNMESSGLAQVITLGNGVTQNSSEEVVAVGGEGALSDSGRNFTIFVMTHPRLSTDYRFKGDGDAGTGSYQEMTSQVDSPVASESHNNSGGSVKHTSGYRLPLVYTTSSGNSTDFPKTGAWASRLIGTDQLQYWRMLSGENFVSWMQAVDFGNVVGVASGLPTPTNVPTPTTPPLTTQCVTINANTDDAEQNLNSNSVTLGGSSIDLGYGDGNPQMVGLRFNGVNVFQGANIYDAKITFAAAGASSTATSITFWGQAIDNSPTFTSGPNNIAARTKTTASTNWSAIPSWSNNSQYDSPSLKTIVQEVVNRGSWQPGNSMSFLITGTGQRGSVSYENIPSTAPKLCVSYITGSGTQPTSTPVPTNSPTPSPTPVPQCVVYTSTDIPKNLPNGTSSVTSTLNIPDYGTITDVNLTASMTHPYVGDLGMTLTKVSPGSTVTVLDRPGVPATTYGCSGDNLAMTLDDSAASYAEGICSGSTPTINGTYRPNNPLNTFNGLSSNGQWNLQVTDYYPSSDAGTLTSWSLRICRYPQPSPTPTSTPVPTNTPTATPTPSPTPVNAAYRVTTYELEAGEYTGTNYNLTISNNLSSNYFVMLNGASVRTDANHPPQEDGVRISGDPFGNLGSTTAANQLALIRSNAAQDWTGAVTVVECLANCTTSGFQLRQVLEVALPQGTANALQTVTANLSANHNSRVVPFGGLYGGGMTNTSSSANEWGVTFGTKIEKVGTNQIELRRYGGESRVPRSGTMTVYIVEWGTQWTVQTANVTGTNVGNSINVAGEYNTAAISSVARDQSWVWGTGFTRDDGIGDGAFGQVITLGNGVTQNANESTVAVGGEASLISPGRDFQVYIMQHPSLRTDYRFKADGDIGSIEYQELTLGVDAALTPEIYNNGSSSVRTTQGRRFGFLYSSASGTGQQYPVNGGWAFRMTGSTSMLYWRPFADENFAAWAQSVDFGNIN